MTPQRCGAGTDDFRCRPAAVCGDKTGAGRALGPGDVRDLGAGRAAVRVPAWYAKSFLMRLVDEMNEDGVAPKRSANASPPPAVRTARTATVTRKPGRPQTSTQARTGTVLKAADKGTVFGCDLEKLPGLRTRPEP